MKGFTKEQIINLHDKMIDKFGGDYGIRDERLLESSCVSPFQSFGGMELFPSIFDKAAKYLENFAGYQIFYDGNKRTGIEVTKAFLNINGYELDLDFSELYNLTMKVANYEIEAKDVSSILEEHSRKLQTPILDQMQEYDLEWDFPEW